MVIQSQLQRHTEMVVGNYHLCVPLQLPCAIAINQQLQWHTEMVITISVWHTEMEMVITISGDRDGNYHLCVPVCVR